MQTSGASARRSRLPRYERPAACGSPRSAKRKALTTSRGPDFSCFSCGRVGEKNFSNGLPLGLRTIEKFSGLVVVELLQTACRSDFSTARRLPVGVRVCSGFVFDFGAVGGNRYMRPLRGRILQRGVGVRPARISSPTPCRPPGNHVSRTPRDAKPRRVAQTSADNRDYPRGGNSQSRAAAQARKVITSERRPATWPAIFPDRALEDAALYSSVAQAARNSSSVKQCSPFFLE